MSKLSELELAFRGLSDEEEEGDAAGVEDTGLEEGFGGEDDDGDEV